MDKRLKYGIIGLFAIACLFIICIVATDDDIRTQDGFAEYAKTHLDDIRFYGSEDAEYIYYSNIEDNVGIATAFENSDLEYINNYREAYIDKIKENVTPDKKNFQGIFFNSVVTESSKNTVSMMVSYQIAEYHKGYMAESKSGMKTWIFNKKDGSSLAPAQVFKDTYKKSAAEYFERYFSVADKDLRVEDYKKYVSDNKKSFNKFMLSDAGVTFFFPKGQLYGEEMGNTCILVNIANSDSWIRTKVLTRYIDPDKKMVALTYDDGPGGKAEAKIQKLLEKHGAVATFFYSGYMIKGKEEQMKNALDIGCEIGNHTWNHPQLTKCDKDQLKKQLGGTSEAIEKAIGQKPTVFRPSYGDTNKKINKKSKLPVILWDVDTLDWKSRDADEIMKIIKKTKKLDKKVILMHSLYDSTADATKKLLPWLEEHGYQTVTVSELIEYKYGEKPKKGKAYFGWGDDYND